MKTKDLLKQLNNLKNTVVPDATWKDRNRDILLCQIKAQTRFDFEKKGQILATLLPVKLFWAVAKPVGSMVAILAVIFAAWTATVGATKNSLPGDLFYGVKLTSERVAVNLALNDEKKANLEIQYAERRLDEIKKIVNNNETKPDKKDLAIPLKKYQESMDNVKASLAKLEKTDKQSALKVANLVEDKTKEYINTLEIHQDTVASSQTAANIDTAEAISASKQTGDKALDMIIQNFEESGKLDVPFEEVTAKVQARIDDLSQQIAEADTNLQTITANKLAEAEAQKAAEVAATEASQPADSATTTDSVVPVNDQPATETPAAEQPAAETEPSSDTPASEPNPDSSEPAQAQEEPLPTIAEAQAKLAKAKELLAEAQEFLKHIAISQSFSKVKEIGGIVTLVKKVVKANEQYLQAIVTPSVESNTDEQPAMPIENEQPAEPAAATDN